MKRFDDFFTEAQQYSTILKNYKENGEVFNDPNFSPNFDITDTTIKINQDNIIYRRISDFYKAPLFQKNYISDNYIDEGELNESGLIAALVRTAEQPKLIKKLFDTHLITENDDSIDLRCGAVVILLHAFNRQTPILIDTNIPFIKGTRKPLFIRPTSLKCSIWFCLVEKAIAKLLGGYSAVSNISFSQSCYILFGCHPQNLTVGRSISEKSENETNGEIFTFNGFGSIAEWLEKGAVVSASIDSSNSQSASEKGLIPCESYLVCSVNSVDSKNFVVLRSPKNSIEWLGDWSNTSNDLTLEMRKKVGLKSDVDDGTFCMIEENFLSYFSNFEIAIPSNDSMHSKSFVSKIEGDNGSMQTFAFKLKENENDDVDVVVTVEKWSQNSCSSTFSEEKQEENESTVEVIVVFNGGEKISLENMSLENCKKFSSNEKVFGFSLHLTDKSPFSITFNHSTGPSQNEEIYATVNCVSDFDIYNIDSSDQLSPENEKIGATFTNDLNDPNNETDNESSIAAIVENQLSSFADLESQMESYKIIDDEKFNESLQKLIELSKNSNLRLDEKVLLFFQSVKSIVSSSIPTQPSNTQKNSNDPSDSLSEHREVVEKYFGLLDEMQRTLPNLLYMSLSKLEEFDGFTQKVCEQLKIDPNESSYEIILNTLQKQLNYNGENIDLENSNGNHEESQPDQQLNDDMNFFNDSFENLTSEKQNDQLVIDQINEEEEEIIVIESASFENTAENSKEEKDDKIAVNNEDQVFLNEEEEESKSDNNNNQITSESEFCQIDIQIPDTQSMSENQQADQTTNIINNDDQNLNQDTSEKLDHFTESQNESPRDALDASSELKVETEESKTESQKQADSEFAFEIEEEEDYQIDHPTENDGEIVLIERTLEMKIKLESGGETDSSQKEEPIVFEPPNQSELESTSKDEIVFKLIEENQGEIDVEFEGEIHSESEEEKKEKENKDEEETEKEADSQTHSQDESQRDSNNCTIEDESQASTIPQNNNNESVSQQEDYAMILSQSSEPPPANNNEHKSDSGSISRKQKQPQTKIANKTSTKPSTAKKPPQRSRPKKRAAAPQPQTTPSQPKQNLPPLADSEAASQSSVPPVQTTDSSSSRRRASSASNRKPKSSSQIVSAKNGSKVAGYDDKCLSNANVNTSAASQPHTSIYPSVVQDSSSTSSVKRRRVRKTKEENDNNKNNNNNNNLEGSDEQCKMMQNSESESEIGTGKFWKVQQTEDPEKPFLLSKEMPDDKKLQQRKQPTRRSASATNNKKQPTSASTTTPSKTKPVRKQSASKAKLEMSPLCVSESESPQKQEEKQSTVEPKTAINQPTENDSSLTKNEQHQKRSSSTSKKTSKAKPVLNIQKSNKEKVTTQKTEQTPVDSETKKAQKNDHDDTHRKRKHNHTEKVTDHKQSHTQNSEKKKKTQKQQPKSEPDTSKRRARSVQCRDSRNHNNNNTEEKTVAKPSTNSHVSFESPLQQHQRQPPPPSSSSTYSSSLAQNDFDFASCECLGFCGSYQKLLRKRRQDRILYDELNEENFFVDRSDRYWDPKLAYEREYFNLKTGGNFTCPKVANYCNRRRNPSCSTRSRPDLSAFVNYFELEGTQLNCSYLPKRFNKY